MLTSSNNSSHILKKDVSDIFEQIKKKAEDISTSEGSIPLFQNLSNPTNLTNPQIISLRKIGYFENIDDSKNLSKVKKSRNKTHIFKKAKSEISELHDQFLISESIKKLILQKEPKRVFDKPQKRIYMVNNRIKNIGIDKKNQTLEPHNKELDLWSKIKNYKPRKEKEIRVNKRKNITVRDYLLETKNIQLMKYIHKNKVLRLNMLANLKKNEIESINNALLSLENNKDYIIANYKENYASYVSFLIKQRDTEQKKNFGLFLQSENIKKEIKYIQFKINKIKKEKTFFANMVLLLIQIKEKMPKIPEHAPLIFGNYDGQRHLMKKQKTNLEDLQFLDNEINIIMKYKGKPIYNDIFEFDYDFGQIEDRVRNKFKIKDKLDIEIEQLKEEYNKVKKEGEYDPYAEDKQELKRIIDKLKYKNEELKQEIISLKIKFADARHNILNKKKHILKHSLSTLSLKGNYNKINNINENKNITLFFNNTNTYYDNYSTLYEYKNIYTLSNFNFNKMNDVSDLYESCFRLYNTTKVASFNDIDIIFDVEKDMKFPTINEDLVIIKMLEYIDQVATLLILDRNKYLSDTKLRKKYERIRTLLEKDKRRMILINNLKDEAEKQKLKLQELELKKNKVHYIPTKKSEYKYYFKAQRDHTIHLKKLSELKKPPTFEDFMYDIMV